MLRVTVLSNPRSLCALVQGFFQESHLFSSLTTLNLCPEKHLFLDTPIIFYPQWYFLFAKHKGFSQLRILFCSFADYTWVLSGHNALKARLTDCCSDLSLCARFSLIVWSLQFLASFVTKALVAWLRCLSRWQTFVPYTVGGVKIMCLCFLPLLPCPTPISVLSLVVYSQPLLYSTVIFCHTSLCRNCAIASANTPLLSFCNFLPSRLSDITQHFTFWPLHASVVLFFPKATFVLCQTIQTSDVLRALLHCKLLLMSAPSRKNQLVNVQYIIIPPKWFRWVTWLQAWKLQAEASSISPAIEMNPCTMK